VDVAVLARAGRGGQAVDLIEQAQSLADGVRADAVAQAARLVAEAHDEADSIRTSMAELRASIPAMENDFQLRRSLALQELGDAQAAIAGARAEARRIVEDASSRAAQILAETIRQADEMMARGQADVDLARFVATQQLDQRRNEIDGIQEQAETAMQAERVRRQNAWVEEEAELREALRQEQDAMRAQFKAMKDAEEATWQISQQRQEAARAKVEAELSELRQQIIAERLTASDQIKQQHRTAVEECDELFASAHKQATELQQQGSALLETARHKATTLMAEAEATAELRKQTVNDQVKALLEEAQRQADEKVTEAKAKSKQLKGEAKAVPVDTVGILETMVAGIPGEDYKYYDSTDTAVPIDALFAKYVSVEAESVALSSIDAWGKNDRYDTVAAQFIKYTGEYAPMFIGPALPEGMRLKHILAMQVGNENIVSVGMSLQYAGVAEGEGLPLAVLLEISQMVGAACYTFEGADGYTVEIEGEDIEKGVVTLVDGIVRVTFDGLPKNTSIKELLYIRANAG